MRKGSEEERGEEVGPGCLRAEFKGLGEKGSGTSAEPPGTSRTYKAEGSEDTAPAPAF